MKVSPMKQKMLTLRASTADQTLDSLERMLNNSKGTGTTNLLIEQAKQTKVPILVESEEVAKQLQQYHPELTFLPFSAQLPGKRLLIDVSVMWVMLREAQKIRRQAEDLLNWMEYKQRDW